MAKPWVLREEDGGRVPFLRGILTRSLQNAGLSFADAYRLASAVRSELGDDSEISSDEIHERTLRHLDPFGADVVRRYRARRTVPPQIRVLDAEGHVAPFSRGRHRLTLSASGITADQAGVVVARVLDRLASEGAVEVDALALGRLTYDLLRDALGPEAARRYAVWQEFLRSDVPLVVLVGGATGTGKSTLSAELATRLEILRTQSTDMLREVMRMMVPERLLPILHTSSFQAWERLPQPETSNGSSGDSLATGFLAQVELVSVACDAVLNRALKERVSLIVEGVHVCPALLESVPLGEDGIVVPVMLGVLSPKKLRQQIKGRGKRVSGRRAKRYLSHFDDIWRLQSYLLSEADRTGIPIVTNEEVEESVQHVVDLVITELSRHFEGNPSKVFG